MEIEQLELDLWRSLETAALFPQTADFPKLCDALDQAMVAARTAEGIAPQSTSEQLILGAEAISQLSQLYAARVELLLSDWERRYNPIEPVVDLEDCVGLFVQSLNLDVADLFEPPEAIQYPANRQARTQVTPDNSLVGAVDKAVLLEVVDQISEEYLPTEAEFADQLRRLAGEEDVRTWQKAITRVMQQSDGKAVSLLHLQEALGMPLIEVWLCLLLGEQEQYQWETGEEFYNKSQDILWRCTIRI
jgi:hypothetical protein